MTAKRLGCDVAVGATTTSSGRCRRRPFIRNTTITAAGGECFLLLYRRPAGRISACPKPCNLSEATQPHADAFICYSYAGWQPASRRTPTTSNKQQRRTITTLVEEFQYLCGPGRVYRRGAEQQTVIDTQLFVGESQHGEGKEDEEVCGG